MIHSPAHFFSTIVAGMESRKSSAHKPAWVFGHIAVDEPPDRADHVSNRGEQSHPNAAQPNSAVISTSKEEQQCLASRPLQSSSSALTSSSTPSGNTHPSHQRQSGSSNPSQHHPSSRSLKRSRQRETSRSRSRERLSSPSHRRSESLQCVMSSRCIMC